MNNTFSIIKTMVQKLIVTGDGPSAQQNTFRSPQSSQTPLPVRAINVKPLPPGQMSVRVMSFSRKIEVSLSGKAINLGSSPSALPALRGAIFKKGYWHGRVGHVDVRWKEGDYRYVEVKGEPDFLRTRVSFCGSFCDGWYRIHLKSVEINHFYQAIEVIRAGLQGKVNH